MEYSAITTQNRENLQQNQSGEDVIPSRTQNSEHLVTTAVWLNEWPRIHRQAFALINGERNSERLAMLLRKSPRAMEQNLDDLLLSGFIALRTPADELVMRVSLLQESFIQIEPWKEEFAVAFYERLFAQNSTLRQNFTRIDVRQQARALTKIFTLVMAGLEKGKYITPELKALGQHCEKSIFVPEYLPFASQALIETFQDSLRSKWGPTYRHAWLQAYQIIARVI